MKTRFANHETHEMTRKISNWPRAAVAPVSQPANAWILQRPQVWKLAIQQTWKSALQGCAAALMTVSWSQFSALPVCAAETNSICRACCRLDLVARASRPFDGKAERASETPAPQTSDKSIYQVESKWTTDAGKEIKLGALAGKPQMLLMFFANCTYACPILVGDLQRIEAALPPELRGRVGFTLVSFDSQRDTPAALADYRRTRQLTGENWTLLHGQPDDVLELAALLGIRYKQDANGQFEHSNVITLLNAKGEIVFQLTGLDADPQEMVRRIEQMLK
jgi:protein SCO1/2